MVLAVELCVIVSDSIVVIATWVNTLSHTREAARLGIRLNLSSTFLRDGKRCLYLYPMLNTGLIVSSRREYLLLVRLQTAQPISATKSHYRRVLLVMHIAEILTNTVVSHPDDIHP